jgi:hypothetical protein
LGKLKQFAAMGRQEMKALLPETAQHIHGILQNAGQGSAKGKVRLLYAVGTTVVNRHPTLQPEIAKPECRRLVVSMLQAASEKENIYRNSFCVSQICFAQ